MIPLQDLREELREYVLNCDYTSAMLMLGFLYGMIHTLESRWPEMQAYRSGIRMKGT